MAHCLRLFQGIFPRMIPIAQMSVSPAKVRPKPTNPQRKTQQRIGGQCQDNARQHQQPRAQTDLALQGPTRPHAGNDGEAGLDPCFRAPLENRDLPLAWLKQAGGHACPLA